MSENIFRGLIFFRAFWYVFLMLFFPKQKAEMLRETVKPLNSPHTH